MANVRITTVDHIREHRRRAEFGDALRLLGPRGDDDDAARQFERDRVYFELGLFKLIAKRVDAIAGIDDVWHKALRSWALLKQDKSPPPLPDPKTQDEADVKRWFELTGPVYRIRSAYLPDATETLTLIDVEGGPNQGDCPEVLIARARLAGAVVGTATTQSDRDAAFGLVEAIHSQLVGEDIPASQDPGRLLNQLPFEVDATFYWARANFLNGRPEAAEALLDQLFERTEEAAGHMRHVAAHLLRARIDRFTGKTREHRLGTIGAAKGALRTMEIDGEVSDNDAWVELERMHATAEIPKNPRWAIQLLEGADARLGDGPEERRKNLAESSQTIPRLHMATGSPSEATQACLRLLHECGLSHVADAAASPDGEPPTWDAALLALKSTEPVDRSTSVVDLNQAYPDAVDSPGTKRALLRVADVIRAQGDVDLAIAWVEALREHYEHSRSTLARHISLLISAGRQPEALALAERVAQGDEDEPDSQIGDGSVAATTKTGVDGADEVQVHSSKPAWINDVLRLEMARCFLANGRLNEAEQAYRDLSASPAASNRVSGYAGLIDVARRRRRLDEARRIADYAKDEVKDLAGHLRGEVCVAAAWAEIQLGYPHNAIDDISFAIQENPYELAPWLARLRCLRLLGKHGEAIEVANGLLAWHANAPQEKSNRWSPAGPPERHNQSPTAETPPDLSASHGSVIRSELGWTMLDLDESEEAIGIFDAVVERSPYFSTAARGALAARRDYAISEIVAKAKELLTSFPGEEAAGGTRDVNLEAARVLIGRGAFDAAAPFVDAVESDIQERGPSADAQIRVLFALADAHLDAADGATAAKYVRRLERMSAAGRSGDTDDRIVMLKARVCLINRDPKGALDELETVTHDGEATLLAKVICKFELREFEAALEGLATEGLDETESDVRNEIRAWILLALSESPREKPKKAIQYLDDASEVFERLDATAISEAHLGAVLQARRFRAGKGAHHRLGDGAANNIASNRSPLSIAPAIGKIEDARRLRPDDPSLMRDHAALLLEKGDLRGAHRHLHRAAQLDPNDARIQLLAGVAHYRRGDVAEAKLHFARATSLDSLDYVHYRALAKVCLANDEIGEAESVVRRGLVRSHEEGDLALELLQLEIQLRKAQAMTNPLTRQRMLRSMHTRLQVIGQRPKLRHQSHEIACGYRVLAATVAIHLGLKADAREHTRKLGRLDEHDPRLDLLRAHIAERGPLTIERVAPLLLLVLGVLTLVVMLTPSAGWLLGWDKFSASPDLDPVGLAVPLFAFVLAASLRRVVGFSWKEVGVELSPSEPVSEVVHTDLDFSSNRLLLISGFSNYRPHIPAEDHEPRLFAMRWGGS